MKLRPPGRRPRTILAITVACVAAAIAAGCSSSSSSTASSSTAGSSPGTSNGQGAAAGGKTIQLNEGTGSISWNTATTPDIAYFIVGQSNSYLVAEVNGAKAAAKAAGVNLTIFDANFDLQTQIGQIQDAVTSHKYNAFIVNPVSGQVQCGELSQTLLQDKIPVSVVIAPLCARTYDDGASTWQPGTLNFVGDTEGVDSAAALFQYAAKANPGKQTVAFFGGPQQGGPTETSYQAVQNVEKSDPNFNVVATYYTDYTTGTGLADAQTLLQAHPNVSIILSGWTGVTQGVVEALTSAGKLKQVKIYDMGGTNYDVSEMNAGVVTAFSPYFPYSAGSAAVTNMANALKGQSVPRFVGLDGHAPITGLPTDYPVITPQTLKYFKAEYS
jgi:ribose transport system substrate-binding protein